MELNALHIVLAQAAPSGAQPAPFWTSLVPLGLLMVVFYFILIRPQQKKAKEHAELLKGVKPGDKVLTSGGVIGVIVTVKEKSVTLRSADTKLELTKAAIAEITERGGSSAES
jgi:preprotein translocase subunit YajC